MLSLDNKNIDPCIDVMEITGDNGSLQIESTGKKSSESTEIYSEPPPVSRHNRSPVDMCAGAGPSGSSVNNSSSGKLSLISIFNSSPSVFPTSKSPIARHVTTSQDAHRQRISRQTRMFLILKISYQIICRMGEELFATNNVMKIWNQSAGKLCSPRNCPKKWKKT